MVPAEAGDGALQRGRGVAPQQLRIAAIGARAAGRLLFVQQIGQLDDRRGGQIGAWVSSSAAVTSAGNRSNSRNQTIAWQLVRHNV
jgi:hypothetical protein